MFDNFYKYFNTSNITSSNSIEEFIGNNAGKSFGNGLYHIFNKEDSEKWTKILTDTIPVYKDKVIAFGHDWIGKIYFYNIEDKNVGFLDPFDCKTYSTDIDFIKFHNEEIVTTDGECFAPLYYNAYLEKNNNNYIKYNRCAGYKVPIFLGGEDAVDNLEDTDLDVNWHMTINLYKTI